MYRTGVTVTTNNMSVFVWLEFCNNLPHLIIQNVQADGPVAVDVHMVNFRSERDLGWLEGIVGREVDVQEEHTLVVGAVLGAHNGCLPMELIILVGGTS